MLAEFKFADSRLARREIVARQGAQAGVIWPPYTQERAMPNSDLHWLTIADAAQLSNAAGYRRSK